MKFQSIKKVENNKYLWDVVDVLRNELSIAEDGHVDYVECIDKLKEEIKELKRIKAEKQVFLADAYVKKSEVKAENMKLKERVEDLKDKVKSKMRMASAREKELLAENEELKSFHVFATCEMKERQSKIEELKQQVKELKLALVDQEDDIVNTNKVLISSNRVTDGYIEELKAEINDLKNQLNHKAIKLHQDRIPKEYRKEADEFFEHNPNQDKVRFYMLDEYDFNDATNGGLLLNEDDAICVIDNDNL